MQELLSPAPTRSYVLLLLALNRHFAAFYIGSQTREFYNTTNYNELNKWRLGHRKQTRNNKRDGVQARVINHVASRLPLSWPQACIVDGLVILNKFDRTYIIKLRPTIPVVQLLQTLSCSLRSVSLACALGAGIGYKPTSCFFHRSFGGGRFY